MTVLEDAPPPTDPVSTATPPTEPAPTATPPTEPPPTEPALTELPLRQLRDRRAALQAEAARAFRWERLVQARLDLATDAVHPAEQLEGSACETLRAVLRAAVVLDPADDLREVAVLRRELRAYTRQVSARLERTTDELVARYTADPGRCLEHTAPA